MAENDSTQSSKETDEILESLPIVLFINTTEGWYSNIAHFLTYGECPYLSYKEKTNIKLKASNFVIWDNCLYQKNIDDTFLMCVDKAQRVVARIFS